MNIKNIFSTNVMLCILVDRYQSVRGISCLNYLYINSEWRHQVPPEHLYMSTNVHDVTSQKILIIQEHNDTTLDIYARTKVFSYFREKLHP
jgi:hypothetical protein